MTLTICALDVETDGVHSGRWPWEIAAIRREPDGTQTEHHWFVDVDFTDTPDGFGVRVGGFYDRHPVGRYLSGRDDEDPTRLSAVAGPASKPSLLSPYAAAQQVARVTHGALIVGAVPSFDTECLAAMLRTQGLLPAWKHRLRCVETLTAGHLRREVGGLKDCAAALGIEHPDAHTALGDARTALAIWDAVMGAAQ